MSQLNTERLKLYSVPELLDLSGPGWLIEKLFPVEALIGVYGPSGHGKSFLALDWALSIADGREWVGRPVQEGAVVYVAAEGGRSIRKRVAAWLRERGRTDIPAAFFLLEGVQVRDRDDLKLLASRLAEREIEPALIVLDTLARCFVGGDENSAQEMGEFVDGLEWLRRATRAAIIVVHHTGKQAPDTERGSSALRAAVDVMIRVWKRDNVITVENTKQKDDEEFPDIHLRLKTVVVEGDNTSCVIEPSAGRSATRNGIPAQLKNALAAITTSPDDSLTTAEWARKAGLKDRTLHSHRKALVTKGLVEEIRRGVYRVTAQGRATSANCNTTAS